MSSDEEIDRESEAILSAHGRDLERFLRGTMQLADDMIGEVINDALLAIVQKRRRNQTIDNVRSYLFTVARNAAIDHLKVQARYAREIPASEIINDRYPGRDPFEDAENERELSRMVSELPLRQRQVFVLRRLCGYSGRETAEILGISEGSIGPTLTNAMKYLRARKEDRA